jgi:predicted metalloprotease with PDZ domain
MICENCQIDNQLFSNLWELIQKFQKYGFLFCCMPTKGASLAETQSSEYKSISSSAQYVTLHKYVSHPSLVIHFFCNPTHKTETGTANK